MLLTTALVLLISAHSTSLVSQSQAQSTAAPPRLSVWISPAEATELTNGWARLAEGNAEQAAVRADRALSINPRSVAAFVLGVEAELAVAHQPPRSRATNVGSARDCSRSRQ